jgi:hypothetical protein
MAFDHSEGEKPFEEGRILFEQRDTERGERKRLKTEDTHERNMLNARAREPRLKRQGLTELTFETARPGSNELDTESVRGRPRGARFDPDQTARAQTQDILPESNVELDRKRGSATAG